jgi:drug/metabolite transporter (DMT)-like permease
MLYFSKHWRGIFKLPVSIVLLSLVAGWTNLSYVLAIIDGEVMRVMLLFYLSPLWTLILAHFWLKEETHLAGIIAIVTSLLGAYIMLYDPLVSGFPVPRNTAEWLGLSSGFGFALTNVMTRKSVHLTLRAKSFAIWVGVIVVCLIAMPVMQVPLLSPMLLTPINWLVMVVIAVLLIAATLFVQYGVTRIKATRASVLFLFELVVAAIAAYYLTDETMNLYEWIGGALIVAASVFAAFNHKE